MDASELTTDRQEAGKAATFCTTHWSQVLAAGRSPSPGAEQALESLCCADWYPLYAFLRWQGHSPVDAQDVVQDFFSRLLAHNYLGHADRTRGRFRNFLLTSLKHFLINEWNKANCQKRGGGRQIISLNTDETESRRAVQAVDGRTPEKAFARQWAMVLLERVLNQLEGEFAEARQEGLFQELRPFLTGEDGPGTYAEVGRRLGKTEGSLKVAVHRLRRRYRELLREEISGTVESPRMIDEEIRELFAALID